MKGEWEVSPEHGFVDFEFQNRTENETEVERERILEKTHPRFSRITVLYSLDMKPSSPWTLIWIFTPYFSWLPIMNLFFKYIYIMFSCAVLFCCIESPLLLLHSWHYKSLWGVFIISSISLYSCVHKGLYMHVYVCVV